MDVCAWCPFLTPRQQNRAPYLSLLRTNTLFCDPPLAIFTAVPYIPTYPWPRCLYMTVLKIANDFLSVECFAEEKLLGGISHHFQMCSLFTASFEELGDFQYVGSVFPLDIFFFQNCWLRYGLKRQLLLSTEKCSEIIVLHLLSPRPSF